MFGFWDWVGGRYSMDSAIGLSTMLAIGPERISRDAGRLPCTWTSTSAPRPFSSNLPVLMGLLAVWYNNFFGAQTVAVLPYDQYLKRFPAYLQQLTMESYGKTRDARGRARQLPIRPARCTGASPAPTASTPFIQLLHQGTQLIPCDFIGFRESLNPLGNHQVFCWRTCSRKPRRSRSARRPSKSEPKARPSGWCRIARSKATAPATLILAERLTPEILGKLVALYEHSVFTQGVIWDIDPFDQFGVELGKVLAAEILPSLSKSAPLPEDDSSTVALLRRYRG